ncbi:MAG TPA: hypothetical protein VHL34_24585 [Rhizomicrobium sp.]|nr:hypothetical protein [Rhizomicrobium sp.]
MEHDIRTLQTFIEAKFTSVDEKQQRMHVENQTALATLTNQVLLTNGRVRNAEVAIAVLKFAVYTIGGSILLAGLQVIVGRFGGHT